MLFVRDFGDIYCLSLFPSVGLSRISRAFRYGMMEVATAARAMRIYGGDVFGHIAYCNNR